MMKSDRLLEEIFSSIKSGSECGSDREWELIENFVRLRPDTNLAELIYDTALIVDVEPWMVGALFDHLIWNTPDNGNALIGTIENWLRGDNLLKTKYALSMQYVFPFCNQSEMNEVLKVIRARWPELAPRCEEIAERRAHQSRNAT